MPNGTYGGVRGKETKVGQKTFVSRPTRLILNFGMFNFEFGRTDGKWQLVFVGRVGLVGPGGLVGQVGRV